MKFYKILLFSVFLCIGNFSFAQKLTLEDLLKIYGTDSTFIKQFCAEKQFAHTEIRLYDQNITHQFEAADNKDVILEVLFPKGLTRSDVKMHYQFNNKKEFAAFEESCKALGFSKQTITPSRSVVFINHEKYYINKDKRYKKGVFQIELMKVTNSSAHYQIFLHKACD